MNRFVKLVSVLLVVMLGAVSFSAAQATEGRYLILMRGNSVPSDLAAEVSAAGGELVRTLPQVGIAVATSSDPAFADSMSSVRGVKSVGAAVVHSLPQAVTPEVAAPDVASPDFAGASAFYDAGLLWGINRVSAPDAWAAGATGSPSTVVAVIDTGIATNHPDLASNIVYMDCYNSAGSFADGACSPYPDASDHGTHVAGTVAANFGGGVVGVGPQLGLAGYNTFEIIPGFGLGAFTDSRWAAMLDAADRGFDVINMSLGSSGVYGGQGTNGLATFVAADKRVAQYVTRAGVTVVASAGNDGLNTNGTYIHIPGDYPSIINVAATGIQPAPRFPYPDAFDIQAFYSNFGAAVTVAAPGGDCGQIGTCNADRPADWFEYLVLSAIVTPDPTCAATQSCPVGWGWKAGTSMAAPHVAGVAGVIMDENPTMSPRQVTSLIKQTAENLGDRQLFGHGMVNLSAALGLDN
jgi:subtilisin family serine protease